MAGTAEQWSGSELEDLRKTYYVHAYELADALQDAVLGLETGAADGESLKTVKRQVHTLKGDSNSIGLTALGALCHRMEDVLASLADGAQADPEAVDVLLAGVDGVYRLLAAGESGSGAAGADDVVKRIDRYLGVSAPAQGPPSRSAPTEYEQLQVRDALGKGLRVYEVTAEFHPQCGEKDVAALLVAKRLGGLGVVIRLDPDPRAGGVNGAERMTAVMTADVEAEALRREAFVAGITAEVRVGPVPDFAARSAGPPALRSGERAGAGDASAPEAPHAPRRGGTLRVEAAKVDLVMDLVGELIIGRSMLDRVSKDLESGAATAELSSRLMAVNAYLERTVSDLQKGVMKMRMVPVSQVFRKFPKMVRDLSLACGKAVRLELRGSETELDKGIVDGLGEPLAHIIRNMIDHGIEGPEARRSAGKPGEGLIMLRAYHEAAQIVIEASDDGQGIDTEGLKRKAVERGDLSPADAGRMTEAEARELVFLSGLSTAQTVSATSGRGVGMEAVKSAVAAMKGSVEIDSAPARGTVVRIRLPLTLAVIKALLFEVGGRLFSIPVAAVAEVAKIMTDDLPTVNGHRTLVLRGQTISLISLAELFHMAGRGQRKQFVLVLAAGGKRAGLLIDRLMWQQELVIKAVDGLAARSELIAGASILGDGKVVLILDVPAVFRKAVEEEKRRQSAA